MIKWTGRKCQNKSRIPIQEQSQPKINKARFGLKMPENPYNNLLFEHTDRVEFLKYLWSNFGLSSPFSRGTTNNFPWLLLISAPNLPIEAIRQSDQIDSHVRNWDPLNSFFSVTWLDWRNRRPSWIVDRNVYSLFSRSLWADWLDFWCLLPHVMLPEEE